MIRVKRQERNKRQEEQKKTNGWNKQKYNDNANEDDNLDVNKNRKPTKSFVFRCFFFLSFGSAVSNVYPSKRDSARVACVRCGVVVWWWFMYYISGVVLYVVMLKSWECITCITVSYAPKQLKPLLLGVSCFFECMRVWVCVRRNRCDCVGLARTLKLKTQVNLLKENRTKSIVCKLNFMHIVLSGGFKRCWFRSFDLINISNSLLVSWNGPVV